jgi:hypothetical protein
MEVMIDHMPGTPDGMARAPDGNFWFPLLAKIPPVTKVCAMRSGISSQCAVACLCVRQC